MTTADLATLAVADGIATITLTNPPANGYSYDMMRQLDACVLEARMREDVHALVLTGAGEKFFCAGADIGALREMTPTFKYGFCLHANETLQRLEQTPKLVIAALNGHTVGGGLEVALACDLRWGRRGPAQVGLPEVKLGVLPGTGGTQRLVRLVGRAKAMDLMITGRLLKMDEAVAAGLVHEVLEGDTSAAFLAQVHARARQLACPPHAAARAVGLIKRAVQTGPEVGLAEGLALERELQQQLFLSRDAQEGMAANRERREPRFEGR
ncbi:MAG: enoyl-CoA hydratase/isomerase family protein [Planctomycetes bacterium]|nr:enoyl-CoA hydratase/isomerase family protein [Planctomycetota bacterium]